MDLSASTMWWALAGLLILAELLTGTFYLLLMALGAAAGALASHAGWGTTSQLVSAALVGGGATAAWHMKRARAPRSAPAASNSDVSLDIGQTVMVEAWQDDRTARVSYRGAGWTVRLTGEGEPGPGAHRIVAVHGNRFDVVREAPH
jgi:membrane protein implicated in regulation of membrane protease activity